MFHSKCLLWMFRSSRTVTQTSTIWNVLAGLDSDIWFNARILWPRANPKKLNSTCPQKVLLIHFVQLDTGECLEPLWLLTVRKGEQLTSVCIFTESSALYQILSHKSEQGFAFLPFRSRSRFVFCMLRHKIFYKVFADEIRAKLISLVSSSGLTGWQFKFFLLSWIVCKKVTINHNSSMVRMRRRLLICLPSEWPVGILKIPFFSERDFSETIAQSELCDGRSTCVAEHRRHWYVGADGCVGGNWY